MTNDAGERAIELLAPAGDRAALEAALEAGATAVYFGLVTLNARRGARNFRQEELAPAVSAAHARGVRAYLTLNVDLAERELGEAARVLELARQARADAVLVRDPALLALRPEFPELEFHFSTQTAATSSADVAAAAALGAARVVLAREMTLAEITRASAVPGIGTEVFVQGALCFSISGRCLLSSWAGGHSGNRGTCASPCRVPWTIDGREAATPLSMHDLATVERLAELRRAGVAALKIEGRLKNAAWVRRAVEIYRRALDSPAEDLAAQTAALGAYTGRAMTCGYLDGRRADLTGLAGRERAAEQSPPGGPEPGGPPPGGFQPEGELAAEDAAAESAAADASGATFDVAILVEPRGIVCQVGCAGRTAEWSVPKTVVRRAHKAVPIAHLLELLGAGQIEGCRLGRSSTNDPDFLMVPRAVNAMTDRVAQAIRHARKAPAELLRTPLPPGVEAILEKSGPHELNRKMLSDRPDRARLRAEDVGRFTRQVRPEALVVEGVTAGTLGRVMAAARTVPLIVALPPVFFEADSPRIGKLLEQCKAERLGVEFNSWGGWWLARAAGVRMESGPGLGVLNSLAARTIRQAGARCVTLSLEADRRQMEDLTAHCPSPCSAVVFGRPPLVITRVRLPEQYVGRVFEDRRGIRMIPQDEQGLLVFRPVEPFDLSGIRNERIRVAHLTVDLVRSPDPVAEWQAAAEPLSRAFRFNYDRTLD